MTTPLLLPTEQKPIAPNHSQEWLDSGVDESIVRLNVESLYGNAAIEAIAGDLLAGLGAHSQQHVTQQTKRILDRYAYLADGGWLVTGLDPLNNFEPLQFGQFKPDSPRTESDTGKARKYELKPKSGARLIYLRVSFSQSFKIAQNNGKEAEKEWGRRFLAASDQIKKSQSVEAIREACQRGEYGEVDRIFRSMDGSRSGKAESGHPGSRGTSRTEADAIYWLEDKFFWHWVQQHPEVDVDLCEGAKKAGCLINHGSVAIAAVGSRMFYRKDPEPRLVDDLKPFVQPGRKFIFAFDQDEKPKTRADVAHAEWATARLLKNEGCLTYTAQWQQEEGKGIDDVWGEHGSDRVIEIIESAEPLQRKRMPEGFDPTDREYVARRRRFRFRQYWDILKQDFTLSVGSSITEEYQGYCPTLDLNVADTIFVQGWLGAGKSEAMIRSIAQYAKNRLVIGVVPRNGLGRDLIGRLQSKGISADLYQDDAGLHKQMLRVGESGCFVMCPDSFKEYAVGEVDWEKTVLIIDEFSGVRGELPAKTREFPQIEDALRRAQKVVVLDAFLSDVDLAIVSCYRKGSAKIYKQEFAKSPKPIVWLETRTKEGELAFNHDGIYLPFLAKMAADPVKKFAIATDSKKQAKTLAKLLESFGRKPLLVSADTPSDSQMFMADPNGQWSIGDWDCLIYTPTAQSGLDVQIPFDWGLLICNGVLPPTQMLQMLGRCRQCQQWYVSAPRRSIESDAPTTKLSPAKLKDLSERLEVLLQQRSWQYSKDALPSQVWQDAVGEAYKQFNSECIEELLNQFFQSVTVEFVEDTDTKTYRELTAEVGREDADKTLLADLAVGQSLIEKKKAPSKDQEVWDYKLAQTVEQYPLTESIAEQYKAASGEEKPEILEVFRLFTSNRLTRIKRWVMAQDPKCVEELEESLGNSFVTSSCRLLRLYMNLRLFRDLRLDRLAVCSRSQKPVVDQSHFSIQSPIVTELWEEFQKSDLPDLFFGVDSQQDLWNLVRRCMSAMGFQSCGKAIRVQTEELHKNGKNRDGSDRYSNSQSVYFSAWLKMEESGSEKFREMFPVIVQAIEEQIQRDRVKREQRKLAGLSPGDLDDPIPDTIKAMQDCQSWEEYKRKVPNKDVAQKAWDYLKSYPEGKRLACQLQEKLKRLKADVMAA